MSARIDLSGQVFGRLTVLEDSGARHRNSVLWLCSCECGNIITTTSKNLRNKYTKSCGCLQKEHARSGNARRTHNTTYTPLYAMWTSAKTRAKSRGLDFDLTIQDLVVPEFCPVLGIRLEHSTGRASPNSPSLDRIDNSKGYTKDNVFIISRRANVLKNDASLEELEAVCNYIRKHLNE